MSLRQRYKPWFREPGAPVSNPRRLLMAQSTIWHVYEWPLKRIREILYWEQMRKLNEEFFKQQQYYWLYGRDQ